MGEEVVQKEEEKKEEKKEEEKKEEEANPEIVLKVDMHCEACARKVARALKGFQGVEEVIADSKGSKVVVKGKEADPQKVCERLQKKSGRKVELISPLPKSPQDNIEQNKDPEPPKEDKKDEPPAVVTVVLNIRMHCEACAQVLKKKIRKIKGVETVETDVGSSKVTVKGVVDPMKLVEDVSKKTRKQASIVKDEEESKKEEEKKEEEKKEEKKKEEEEEEKKATEEEEKQNSEMIKRSEYWPTRSYLEYAYAPQFFSDENPNACSLM